MLAMKLKDREVHLHECVFMFIHAMTRVSVHVHDQQQWSVWLRSGSFSVEFLLTPSLKHTYIHLKLFNSFEY